MVRKCTLRLLSASVTSKNSSSFSHFVLDIVGELVYNNLVMLQEIKEFLKGQLTTSLSVSVYEAAAPHTDICYTLTNGALNMRLCYNKQIDKDAYIFVYVQNTDKTLEIREDGDKNFQFYTRIDNQKDIKEIINIIKTKFFPNV